MTTNKTVTIKQVETILEYKLTSFRDQKLTEANIKCITDNVVFMLEELAKMIDTQKYKYTIAKYQDEIRELIPSKTDE